MCPGSLLGSSWLQSRGQTQAVDHVFTHPETDWEPESTETWRVGRWDRDAPPTGKGQPLLEPLPFHYGLGKAAGLGFEGPRGLSSQAEGLRGQIEVQPLMQSPPVAPVVPGRCPPSPDSAAPAPSSLLAVPCLLTGPPSRPRSRSAPSRPVETGSPPS